MSCCLVNDDFNDDANDRYDAFDDDCSCMCR